MNETDIVDAKPAISLIIPAFNEEKLLSRSLDAVQHARARYHDGPQAIEVILADNCSTDRTPEIAHAAGCRVAHV
jgi:glycosyltransferase involved in cell wall biosynthesis